MANDHSQTTAPFHPTKRHHLMRNAPFLGFTRKHGWVVLEPISADDQTYHTRPGHWRVSTAEVMRYAQLPMGDQK